MESTVETSTSHPPLPEDSIGERIRQMRERLRLSQSQFHQRTKELDPEGKGIARTVLIGYEAGKFKPGARELRVLCQAFTVSPSWLLLGENSQMREGLDEARALLFAGVNEPGLEHAFELALGIMCLKPHERQALATLVHGIGSARQGMPAFQALTMLASWMAIDASDRLEEVTGEVGAASALREKKSAKRIEQITKLYEAAFDKRKSR